MKTQKGQSLTEVLVSLTVIIIIVTAIAFTVTNSLKSSQYGKNQTLASQYSQQGMDIIRNWRYTDYVSFSALPAGSYCLADTCSLLTTQVGNICGPVANQCLTSANIPTGNPAYLRQVTIAPNSTDCNSGTGSGTKVTVTVSWTDGQCANATTFCHKVSNFLCITTFDVIPSP